MWDFEFILGTCSWLDVLELLRTHWTYYSRWVGAKEAARNGTPSPKAQGLRGAVTQDAISSMPVRCLCSPAVPLRSTWLPRQNLLAALRDLTQSDLIDGGGGDGGTTGSSETRAGFPLLALHHAEEQSRDMLQSFGVTVKLATKDLVDSLRHLKAVQASKSAVASLYLWLEKTVTDEDTGFVR